MPFALHAARVRRWPRSWRRSTTILTLALIGTLASAQAQVREAFIDPTTTGPGIEALTELPGASLRRLDHFVAVDPAVTNGFLYVHLVGSGGLPENNQIIARHAAERGFHVVSLAYPNWPSVGELTFQSGDGEAPGQVRRERLFGEDASTLVDVDPPNSILNRLIQLLGYLDQQFPDERWARFLQDGQPAWSRLLIGGHSQGAGHAAYLGQDYRLAGVVLLGGPGDFVAGLGMADWLSRPGLTPAARHYAFVHALDPSYNAFQLTQVTLGLAGSGPVQDTDALDPQAWTSQRLTSTRKDVPDLNYHGAVVVDAALPLDESGSPVYAPVWGYLFDQRVFSDDFEE